MENENCKLGHANPKGFMKILLVDDDKMVLQTIGDFLERHGHDLRTAYDGAEALIQIKESTPDLVISDIQMPGMDGIDFLKAIRERFRDLPVILTTGYATVDTAISALRNRAYDYLKKPIQLEELQACIESVEEKLGAEG